MRAKVKPKYASRSGTMGHGRFAHETCSYESEAVNSPQTGIREK
jgi:hypothetical protein